MKAIEEVKAKQEKETEKDEKKVEESESGSVSLKSPSKVSFNFILSGQLLDLSEQYIAYVMILQEEDEGSDTEGLKDILPGDLLDTDLVNTIMNEDDDITKSEDNLEDIGGLFHFEFCAFIFGSLYSNKNNFGTFFSTWSNKNNC